MSSPATIVECVDLVFAKHSELSSFTFHPGGSSKHTVYTIKVYIAFFSIFAAPLSLSKIYVLVSFPFPVGVLIFNLKDQLDLNASSLYTVAGHHDFIFDTGKPTHIADRIQSSSSTSSTNLNFVKPAENKSSSSIPMEISLLLTSTLCIALVSTTSDVFSFQLHLIHLFAVVRILLLFFGRVCILCCVFCAYFVFEKFPVRFCSFVSLEIGTQKSSVTMSFEIHNPWASYVLFGLRLGFWPISHWTALLLEHTVFL